nr:hypothetical protein [uncultured Carboxylicivirga sp.]
MKNYLFVLVGVLFLISCDKNDDLIIDDDTYLQLAYDKSYQYPDGFYFEKTLSGSVYYENTVSINPMKERAKKWIELSTNDKEKAKLWSDLSNDYSSVNRRVTSENQTEKYFEFVRTNSNNANDIVLSRIHRSSYFIFQYDKFKDIDTIGIYNGEQSTEKVKELVEYLWDCKALGFSDKVIENQISENDKNFTYSIISLNIVFGDFGIYDMVYVYDNEFKLDKSTKVVKVKRQLIKEIQGKYNANTFED